MLDLADILLAQAKPESDRTVAEQEAITMHEATEALKNKVGLNDNGRVHLIGKVVYEIASNLGLKSDDIAQLGEMLEALEESPAKSIILGAEGRPH